MRCHFLTLGVALLLLGLSACDSNDKDKKNSKPSSSSVSSSSVSSSSMSSSSQSSSSSQMSLSSSSSSSSISGTKTISGQLTFDLVPFSPGHASGLDYSSTRAEGIERVLVEALDASGNVLATTISGDGGRYELLVPAETPVQIKVSAEMSNTNPTWAVEVVDNTSGYETYYLMGQLADSGPAGSEQQRNLHAPSGWANGRYENTRSAAPFAILDALLEAYEFMENTDPQLNLTKLQVSWSTQNAPESAPENMEDDAAMAQGIISTSHYNPNDKRVYILGKENVDTDEYDRSVVLHEFTHYLEAASFRDDSLGGDHFEDSLLDMRTAFGEGLGNAMAGIFEQSQYYKDSNKPSQAAMGVYMDLEDAFEDQSGFYREKTVQGFLYDLIDDEVDGADVIHMPFSALYGALTSDQYKQFDGTVSIYLLMNVLKNLQPNESAQINALGTQYGLVLNDAYGTGETNGTSSDVVLPIYRRINAGESVEVCTDQTNLEGTGVGVSRFISVDLANEGRYRFTAQHTSGDHADADPDFAIFRRGVKVALANQSEDTSETYESELMEADTYLAVLLDWKNSDGIEDNGGLSCFTFSVEGI